MNTYTERLALRLLKDNGLTSSFMVELNNRIEASEVARIMRTQGWTVLADPFKARLMATCPVRVTA